MSIHMDIYEVADLISAQEKYDTMNYSKAAKLAMIATIRILGRQLDGDAWRDARAFLEAKRREIEECE